MFADALFAAAAIGYAAHGTPPRTARWATAAAVTAILTHATALALHLPHAGGVTLATLFSAFMGATFLLCGRTLSAPGLRRLLSALTAAAALAPLLPPPAAPPAAVTPHVILAWAVYTLAAVAFWRCLDWRLAEQSLRRHPQNASRAALLPRERDCFALVTAAFALLTLTLASGAARALAGDIPITLTHKNLFAVLTWLVFGALLLGRRLAGWRGRPAQRWFFTGYLFLLLSYLGSAAVRQLLLN